MVRFHALFARHMSITNLSSISLKELFPEQLLIISKCFVSGFFFFKMLWITWVMELICFQKAVSSGVNLSAQNQHH